MRVISGVARGRRLSAPPKTAGIRPITDRGKESLFNILGQHVVDADFLDLFAGTGSVGIEALSRGAASTIFVDKSHAAISLVRRNLEHTGLGDTAQVIRGDAFRFLQACNARFRFIFVAPPQYQGLWDRVMRDLDTAPARLEPGGTIIVQIDPSEYQHLPLSSYVLQQRRSYSNVMFCFYGHRSESGDKLQRQGSEPQQVDDRDRGCVKADTIDR